jgi:hypothetical protein
MSKENYTKWQNISYTLKHKVAFLKVEKKLTGKISLKGLLHDLDKIWLYIRYSDDKYIQKRHRENSSHHIEYKKGKLDYVQMIIDFECCHMTKKDKPMRAHETIYILYFEYYEIFLPFLIDFGLFKQNIHLKYLAKEGVGNK